MSISPLRFDTVAEYSSNSTASGMREWSSYSGSSTPTKPWAGFDFFRRPGFFCEAVPPSSS
eukprot:596034-Rhodomonas_salina.1